MKKLLLIPAAALLLFSACKKSDDNSGSQQATETTVLNNFVDGVARPQYNDLSAKSDALYNSIVTLQSNTNETNLTAARTAWKDMRAVWERCEGFLFGPVEDDYYDPYMDTWPTDYVQMDSLLTHANTLTVQDIENLTLSLRGFHPIEYIIFGKNGSQTASGITARQKEYMVSLATDLKSNCHKLAASWNAAEGNYGAQVTGAGTAGSKYKKRQEVFSAMVDGLITICEEVGEGKIDEPFVQQDPQKVESPYSGNSIADFKNNIIGLQNVYLGKYTADGAGMNDIIAMSNAALDNKLQTEITAAINSFDNITHPFEQAIFDQKPQIQQTQAALAALKTTLEAELKPYVIGIIRD